jgi:hypothetical protein
MAAWACPKATADCTRTQPCRSCLGRRNRRKGARKQADARRALGVPAARYVGETANEESWQGVFLGEVKAGKQTQSLAARFLTAERQAEAKRADGDNRPFAFIAMPAGWNDGIIAFRVSAWQQLHGEAS